MVFYVSIGSIRLARYYVKIYIRHLLPYAGFGTDSFPEFPTEHFAKWKAPYVYISSYGVVMVIFKGRFICEKETVVLRWKGSGNEYLVLSTALIGSFGHHKEIRVLTLF